MKKLLGLSVAALLAIPALQARAARCDAAITVPSGFCAHVFARNVGHLRHLTVGADGTVYVALSDKTDGGGIAVLRDTNGNGTADTTRYVGDVMGTGMRIHDDFLYVGEDERVVRYKLDDKTRMPTGSMQVVVTGFPEQSEHTAKSLAFDDAGNLYVNVGAPSNACQEQDRALRSPGMDPCPILKMHGGIWRFHADMTGQEFAASNRYATGLRNDVAITWNDRASALYAVMMGRDQLHSNWPDKFGIKTSANEPAEELLRIDEGGNYGWPYCYYSGKKNKLVLGPEYGGDGQKVGRCDQYKAPLAAFPAHWAPEAITFYQANAFPSEYHNGAFVAFHGSWNRAPLPQKGFVVAFVPFRDGKPSGNWSVFANGFAGGKHLSSPGKAKYRPVGVAVGPHGALYVADSQKGRIWKITAEGL